VQTQAYGLEITTILFNYTGSPLVKTSQKVFASNFLLTLYKAKHAAACEHQAAEGKGAQQTGPDHP